jgi:hypothetical protein
MSTKCGLCEYLKLLVEQTPRDQGPLRETLRTRLGQHFAFQAAQRLAQGRLEEEAQQSQGRKWFMKIDKMDQNKTVTPTIWSQLCTPLFKDLDKRLVTGLIGSMWHGTLRTSHHMRSVFNDCEHGSEMQCSAVLMNLHSVAMEEGHLPQEFTIGADNTYKETKNQIMIWFQVWLLCVLKDTGLFQITTVFLMVGHTHDALDRFFSRFVAAIAGHDFFTVDELFSIATRNLRYCNLKTGHLGQTWHWKQLLSQGFAREISGLGSAHSIRLFQSDGIYMQWKQWMTDELWSNPVQLVSRLDMATVAAFRPAVAHMEFPKGGEEILDWIGKFQHWANHPQGRYSDLDQKVAWLRAAVNHSLPGVYTPGTCLGTLVNCLLSLSCQRPENPLGTQQLHQDILTQLFPGSDVPPIPSETLIRIEGVTHLRGQKIRSNTITPGSTLVVRASGETCGQKMPFLVGVAMQTPEQHASVDQLLVAWWLPKQCKVENFRPA